MRIAIAQINPTVGDLAGNRDKIIEYIEKAKHSGADMIVFPEMSITGYPPEDLLLNSDFVDDNIKMLDSLTEYTRDVTVIAGFADKDERGRIYNAAAIISDGKRLGIHHKQRFSSFSGPDEGRYFSSAGESRTFSYKDTVFGINISGDLRAQDGPYREQVSRGARVIFCMAAEPYYAGKTEEKERMLKEKCRELKSCIFYAGLVGGQDGTIFDGMSLILDPEGRIISSAKAFEEDMIAADVDLSTIAAGSGAAVNKVNMSGGGGGEMRSAGATVTEKEGRIEEIYRALVLGTGDYIRKNGFKKCVLGLSGGIDSALVAVIARDAMGESNVTGISMPSVHSSGATKKDARKIASNLGIGFLEIPINGPLRSFERILRKIFKSKNLGVAGENIQARIRGNILMAFSNRSGQIVLNAGNKSEAAVGYCTLYGDTVGGLAVLSDVFKTLVYEIAGYVNKKEGRELIPESVITRLPSAELAPGQKDSDSIPPYDILDPLLESYLGNSSHYGDSSSKGPDAGILRDIISMVTKSEYKRHQAPPGVRITKRAFGKDRRFPITNKYFVNGC